MAAAAAVLKRVVRLELRGLNKAVATPYDLVAANRFNLRHMSQLAAKPNGGNRVFLVDTLKLVKNLEAEGVPVKQAEAITSAIIEVLNDSRHSFLTKTEMQKAEMSHESKFATFKSEIKNSQTSMAAAAVLKRVVRLELRGLNIAAAAATPYDLVAANRFNLRHMSQLAAKPNGGNRVFLVDTLKLVKNLEAEGVPVKQAEAITSAIIEVLNDSRHSFLTKTEMQKAEMSHESKFATFKSEIKNSQEHHFSLLQLETEKMRTDLRYELDKVTAGLRLDIIDGKCDVMKYCIGTLISITAVVALLM